MEASKVTAVELLWQLVENLRPTSLSPERPPKPPVEEVAVKATGRPSAGAHGCDCEELHDMTWIEADYGR